MFRQCCFILIFVLKYISYVSGGEEMKVAIVGAGASGLACAVELLQKAKAYNKKVDVTLFEKNDRAGKKLLSTGNGKCNLTNLNANAEDYFESANFVSHAINRFSAESTLSFFSSIGLYTSTDSEGRVYPLSKQASSVLDSLRFALIRLGAKTLSSCEVKSIEKTAKGFLLNGEYSFDKVVLAFGGKASVKGFESYCLFKSLNIPIEKAYPSLTKLPCENAQVNALKGLRANVKLSLSDGKKIIFSDKGELLFSQNALSGIVSMQLSPYASRYFSKSNGKLFVYTDFVPDYSYDKLIILLKETRENCADTECENFLLGFMPKKIGAVILKECNIKLSEKIGSLDNRKLCKIAELCKKYPFEISKITDFSNAQVTYGGAKTDAFDSSTMQSKKIRGLYCIGEALNVDGPCGGYNLQWAWSSARLCANSIISEVIKHDKNK